MIDFESLVDLEVVTNQFAGLTFGGATALVSGAVGGSLNELDFPPHSGDVVVFSLNQAMSIAFATPIVALGGFFTYTSVVTIEAFDSSDNSLGTIDSLFSTNLDAFGGTPNEFVQFVSAVGIARVTISTASPSGYVLDDLTLTPFRDPDPDPDPVPEPVTLLLLGLAGPFALRRARRSR